MKGVLEPRFRQRIGYQAGLLGGFAAMAAALLMMGNLGTSDSIAQRQQEDLVASLTQVIPTALYDESLLSNNLVITSSEGSATTVYRAVRNGQVTAVAYEVSGAGYAGEIRLLLGVDAGGKTLGVRVISHAETPGLGDKIELAKDDWILDFNGRSLDNPDDAGWHVRKDGGIFDQFSGATITPRAVVAAVHEGLRYFRVHSGEMLARIPDPATNAVTGG
ncbi:MAG: electron transport complex subunit RsxG [Gammaproteobacteria bacterium]|nr:electron transport complex subunit RsxG [Gammaproteobacteria bacterium]